MNNLFPGFDQFEADKRQQSEQRYDIRMLNRLLSILLDDEDARELAHEAGDEFGFEWFNDAYNPPVYVTVTKLKGQVIGDLLLKSFMKHPIAQAFIEARATHEEGLKVGVVFPLVAKSNWIIHDADVSVIPGVNAIIRNGHDGSRLTVLPFDAFAAGLRQKWQP